MSASILRRSVLAGLAATAIFHLAPSGAAMAQTVESGTFTRQDYSISGSWKIVKEGNRHFVELSRDFKTRSGPDLKLFLSPRSPNALTGRNVGNGSVKVAPIRSAGGQRFRLPAGTDPNNFKSVVIHCERFSKLWGAGGL